MHDLLAVYDTELRGRPFDPMPLGAVSEEDGPIVRTGGLAGHGFVGYRDLGGLDGEELDALIARQVAFFRERGELFEWKAYSHDEPADLEDHLRAAGFEPDERETVVVAPLADIAGEVVLPAGAVLREVTERADLERIARMEEAVWQDGHARSWLVEMLEAERAADPSLLRIFVVKGRRRRRLRRLGSLRARHALGVVVGRRDAAGVAAQRDLPRDGPPPRQRRTRQGLRARAGGRLRRQPPDPGAARFRRRHDDDSVELEAAELTVRPAREDDRVPMALLFAAVAEERDGIASEPPIDVAQRAALFTLDGSLVAVADGELVGMIHVQPTRHGYADIGMAVARSWRGRGVGSALMAAAIEWARARGGLHKLSLGVFAHNAAGVALYKKFGFVEEGRRVKQYRRSSGELWDTIEMGLLL